MVDTIAFTSIWRRIAWVIAALVLRMSSAAIADEPVSVSIVTPVTGQQNFPGVALSSDGKLGVVAQLKRAAIVDAQTGVVLREVAIGSSWTYAAAIDPGSHYIAVASDKITIFALPGLSPIREWPLGVIADVKFSANGKYMAAAADDGRVFVWRTAPDWQQVAGFKVEGPLSAIAISADGKQVAVAQGYNDDRPRTRPEGTAYSAITMWSVETQAQLWTIAAHPNDVAGLTFTDQGTRLVSVAGGTRPKTMLGSSLRLWNVTTGRLVSDFNNFQQRISDLAGSADSEAGLYAIAQEGDRRAIIKVSTADPHLDTVCAHIGVSVDKLSVSGAGTSALGVPVYGAGVIVWKAFPDCKSPATVGFPSEFDNIAKPLWLPDEGILVLALRSGLVGFELAEGGVKFRNADAPTIRSIQAGPEKGQFTTLEHRKLVVRSAETGKISRTIELGALMKGFDNFVMPDDDHVILTVEDSSTRRPGQMGSGTGEVILYDIANEKVIKSAMVHRDTISEMISVPNKSLVLTASWDGTIKAIDPQTLAVIRTYFTNDEQINDIALSPDGRKFAAGWTYEEDGSGTVGVWDLDTDAPSWRSAGPNGFYSVKFVEDGSAVIAAGDQIVELATDTGKGIRDYQGLPEGRTAHSVFVTQPGGVLLANTEGGELYLWDRSSASPALMARVMASQNGVVAFAGERFDTTSIDDLRAFGWVASDEPLRALPPEIFMRDYFEPRLISRLLACLAAKGVQRSACDATFDRTPPLASLNRVQPGVRIVKIARKGAGDEAVVTVEASTAEDSSQPNSKTRTDVYDLRLFRDGQLVGRWPDRPEGSDDRPTWRQRTHVDMPPGRTSFTHDFTVRLPTGARAASVIFGAYAFNEDRVKSQTVEAPPYTLPAGVPARKPRAYVVTIGVDGYEAPSRTLRFAVRDADAMEKALRNLQDYDVIPVKLTSGADMDPSRWQATKASIRAVLARLAGKDLALGALAGITGADGLAQVTPDDLVVITYSGHGHTEPNGSFYLLPTDSGKNTAIDAAALTHFISGEELSEWLRPIDAGQMVMIIDACHSAASVEQRGFKPGPMGDRGLGQLAYDKAMRILAASQADAVALESEHLKQGLLTYALVHDGLATGLDGKRVADLDHDGKLTLAEWLRYGERQTPALYDDVHAGRRDLSYADRDGIIDPRLKASVVSRTQRPALFDFLRRSRNEAVIQ